MQYMAESIGKIGWQSPVLLDINIQIKEEGGKVRRIGNDQCTVRKITPLTIMNSKGVNDGKEIEESRSDPDFWK